MIVDAKYGRNWGDANHTWTELHAETSPHVESVEEIHDDGTVTIDASVEDTDTEEANADENVLQDDICLTCLDEMHIAEDSHIEPDSPPWEGNATFENPSPPPPPPQSRSNGRGNGSAADGFSGFTTDVQGYDRGKINCPFHDDKTPSCQLYVDGHYHCFGCGAHGWIAEDIGDLPDDVLARAASAENDTGTLERGLTLWDECKSIAGTLAERYLTEARKLDPAVLPDIDAVLRFHPRCPFGANGVRHPCLVALFRDVESDAPAGIHRVGLTPDASKIKRLTLGRWSGVRAIKLWPVTHKLSIGEGIETVLGAIRRGAITPPAWAMGPKTDIASFPVLPGIKAMTVLVDRGDPAALDGAEACAARYVAAGIGARWLRTVRVKDFNDLVM
jgi:hypothetical protein